jgi:hypothetical protein
MFVTEKGPQGHRRAVVHHTPLDEKSAMMLRLVAPWSLYRCLLPVMCLTAQPSSMLLVRTFRTPLEALDSILVIS